MLMKAVLWINSGAIRPFATGPELREQVHRRESLGEDALDFNGTLKLKAKVSETMTGWKRWVLKPIDPFFSKQGSGHYCTSRLWGAQRRQSSGATAATRLLRDSGAAIVPSPSATASRSRIHRSPDPPHA